MNIFKVLANGDGTLNEANISAFLGYLLDPYQDHGLGHEFLKRIIQKIEFQISDNFNIYKYEYEVILEQAFRDEDKELKKKEENRRKLIEIKVKNKINDNYILGIKNDFVEYLIKNIDQYENIFISNVSPSKVMVSRSPNGGNCSLTGFANGGIGYSPSPVVMDI